MFGIITKKTMMKVREAFDEIGYEPGYNPNPDKILNESYYCITHGVDLENSAAGVKWLTFFLDNGKTIDKIFPKKYTKFAKLPSHGSHIRVSKDSSGNYITSNEPFHGKKVNVFYTDPDDGETTFVMVKTMRGLKVDKDSGYCLKPTKGNPSTMDITDKKGNLLAVVDENGEFESCDGLPYDTYTFSDGTVNVFTKEYLNSLSDGDNFDADEVLGDYLFGQIDPVKKTGIARIRHFSKAIDVTLLILMATAPILIAKNKK